MLKHPVKRRGKWTEIPSYLRKRTQTKYCRVCSVDYGAMRARLRTDSFACQRATEHIDHLIPRRWLEERGVNPHQTNNLLSVCGSCHGRKKTFEDRLFRGDALGWLQGLRQLGYPVDRIVNFALSVGLEEFKGLLSLVAERRC